MFPLWRIVKVVLAVARHTHDATHWRHECLNGSCTCLGERVSGMNPIVHYNQNAAAFSVWINGYAYSVIQIKWSIGANGGRRPHRTNHYNRLVSFDCQIQKERRLFHRVGSVRDENAVYITLFHQLVDTFSQLEHDFK